ncbi:MAG: citramalate synthase [Clostridiales bacterium]|nr:citramalate synthase [Clostridiales bacterium]
MSRHISILDSTLRDGAQAEGISFTVQDKLKIVKLLDELGVDYIEAGNPGSNPKDGEFFSKVKELKLKNSKIAAFGSTRRKDIAVGNDPQIKALLKADTPVTVFFGKTWDFHVTEIINADLNENLAMIHDTAKFLKENNKEVIFDAEHFFDGYKANPGYALAAVNAAVEGGADCIALCDTNGGAFPDDVYSIIKSVREKIAVPNGFPLGIHCHNDCGMAIANSIMAVSAGAAQVQGTLTGFGERCGNANLSAIIPNLQLKRNYNCILSDNMRNLTYSARYISEIANVRLDYGSPYVGRSAFTHKAGMHIDAVGKNPLSFEHVNPESIGNARKIIASEIAGRGAVVDKIRRVKSDIDKNSPETEAIIQKLKAMEHQGYQYEAADGGFELLIRRELGQYRPFFELVNFRIAAERPYLPGSSATAMIKIIVGGKTEITAAEGEGPINALDKALRKALEVFYPQISTLRLSDYKVRVMDSKEATASRVRVLIESSDGEDNWTTVGVSTDIIEASWIALVDSVEYKLIKDLGKLFFGGG